MSLSRVYKGGKGEAYRNMLKEQAKTHYGIDPEKIDGMREPVLVRQVDEAMDQDTMRRFGRL